MQIRQISLKFRSRASNTWQTQSRRPDELRSRHVGGVDEGVPGLSRVRMVCAPHGSGGGRESPPARADSSELSLARERGPPYKKTGIDIPGGKRY